MMKTISSLWLIVSLVVFPCTLNMENGWCCLFIMGNLVASFLTFKKHNPEYINN